MLDLLEADMFMIQSGFFPSYILLYNSILTPRVSFFPLNETNTETALLHYDVFTVLHLFSIILAIYPSTNLEFFSLSSEKY